jgi:hypothetical protein
MNASTLIAQYRDRVERRSENRLSPDWASEWAEKIIVPGEETFPDCPVRQPAVKKEATLGRSLLRGISSLVVSVQDTSWCQSEVQFLNDRCRKKLLGRW